jgi:hypothetical protein
VRNHAIGERVQIIAGSSESAGTHGRIVGLRSGGEATGEYLVDFGSGRRWFGSHHLTETTRESTLRFFHTEVLRRWPAQSFRVLSLAGSRDELVRFLQDEFEFCAHRAETEADDFIGAFHTTLHRARTTDAEESNDKAFFRASA